MQQARWRIGTTAGLLLGASAFLAAHQILDLGPAASTATVIALATVSVLIPTHCWLTKLGDRLADTTAERSKLQDQAAQYQASQIAHTALREQLIADATAAERAADERAAAAEAAADLRVSESAAAIRQMFEEKRAQELAGAYFAGAMNERNGDHAAWAGAHADLIYLADRRRPRGDDAVGVKLP